jgi:hypothetical protein
MDMAPKSNMDGGANLLYGWQDKILYGWQGQYPVWITVPIFCGWKGQYPVWKAAPIFCMDGRANILSE